MDELAIAKRLFQGDPVADIANDTGVSESAVRFYQQGQRRPRIRQHIEDLERSTFAGIRAQLIYGKRKAVKVLIELLQSGDESIRHQAARTLLREWVSGMDGEDGQRPRMTTVEVIRIIQETRQGRADQLGMDVTPALPAAAEEEGNGDE
jgi:hypothetical protein